VFAPLQEAHNGLWFDPDQGGTLVQVYPLVVGNQQGAFVAVNFALDGGEKTWQAFLYNNFYGFSRVALEDTLIGAGELGIDTTGRSNWTISQVGSDCSKMKFTRRDEFGVVTTDLNLVRIASTNTDAICFTCPEVSIGPFPPLCRR
jgi:hypothetical protein